MNKCSGCGDIIENDKTLCERCFRIQHYNDYRCVSLNQENILSILKKINGNDLVLFVVDLWNVSDLSFIREYIKNPVLLVLTKRDLLPKRLYEEKLIQYPYKIDVIDKIIISSKKNYNFDLLKEKIEKYKTSDKVYVVGYTNAGKSSMINQFIYHYSDAKTMITTSPLPNTTLNTISIPLPNFTFIDTPGLLIKNSLLNQVSAKEIAKITPKKEIKPITYQVKEKQFIQIDKYAIIEAENCNITLFFSNLLEIKRSYTDIAMKSFIKHSFTVNKQDIVIQGLGFMKIKKGKVTVHTLPNVDVFLRPSLL